MTGCSFEGDVRAVCGGGVKIEEVNLRLEHTRSILKVNQRSLACLAPHHSFTTGLIYVRELVLAVDRTRWVGKKRRRDYGIMPKQCQPNTEKYPTYSGLSLLILQPTSLPYSFRLIKLHQHIDMTSLHVTTIKKAVARSLLN